MKYFGTDGIRGKVNKKLTVDIAFKVGKALKVFDCKTMVIGCDTRDSNVMLVSAVIAGAQSMGIDVYNVFVATTPQIIYYSYLKNIIGVIITASHNPYYDNGIKIVYKGKKLNSDVEKEIEDIIDKDDFNYCNYGKLLNCLDFESCYLTRFKDLKTDLKIGIDCSNGASYDIASKIFTDAMIIGNNPNGKNINLDVGCLNIKHLKDYVVLNKLDIGFSFDGDADRLIVVDNEGRIYDGDDLAYIFSRYLKDIGKLNKNSIALTIMSNKGLVDKLNEIGISVIETPVGDKNLIKACEEFDLSLGSEVSGHIIFNDLYCCGDGLLNAYYLIKVLDYYNKPLKELVDYNKYYVVEKNININKINKTIAEIDNFISHYESKIIVRKSGTEDLLRIYVSDKDEVVMNLILSELMFYLGVINE